MASLQKLANPRAEKYKKLVKTFCIELYAEHIGKDSTDVYALFSTSGLLDLLEKDYDDLHNMSMEY